MENCSIKSLWIPKHKVDLSNEKIPYREWEEAGYLTIQDKPYIDYTDVYDWILKVNEHHPVEKLHMTERTHLDLIKS